jgi:hypothetical protein
MMLSQTSQQMGMQGQQNVHPATALHFRLFKPQKNFQNEKVFVCGSVPQLGGMSLEKAIQMNQLSDGIYGFDLQLPGDFSVDNFQYTFFLLGQSGEGNQLFKWDGQCDTKVENRIGNFQEYLFENIWNGMGTPQQIPGQQSGIQQGISSGQQQLQSGQIEQPSQFGQGQFQPNVQSQLQSNQFQQPQMQGGWPREIESQQNVSPFGWYHQTPVQQSQQLLQQQPTQQQQLRQQPLQQPLQQFQQAPIQQGISDVGTGRFQKPGFEQEQFRPKQMEFERPIQQQGVKRRDLGKQKQNRWDDQARKVTDKLIQNLDKARNKLDLLDPNGFDDLYSYSDEMSKDSIRDQRKQWIYRYRDLLDSTLNQSRNLRMEIYKISPQQQQSQTTSSTPIKDVVYGAVGTVGNVASTMASAALHPITTTEKVAETALHTGQSVLNTVEDKLGFSHPTRETKAV